MYLKAPRVTTRQGMARCGQSTVRGQMTKMSEDVGQRLRDGEDGLTSAGGASKNPRLFVQTN